MSYHNTLVPIPQIPGFDRHGCNGALSPSRNLTNLALIGSPRGIYGQDGALPENPNFTAMVEQHDFGPFTAEGLRPAIRALQQIMDEVAVEHPALFGRLGAAEMLCCRLVRGSDSVISAHSWGTAIDLTIDGIQDKPGDNNIQRGLLDLWPIFNRHGFYWGVAFPREHAMHFEASDQLIWQWANDGEFGQPSARRVPKAMTIGDRGCQVLALQQALNRELSPMLIIEDGTFGPQTRAAVLELQRRLDLPKDGTGSLRVLHALSVSPGDA
ncbi:hypothetical protein FNJ84_01690 [Paracoccus sp. M683]|uniref:M15 family metallopeptidase n=1 Tax=Paracoccus sp. M683 TaxID=2594268 RepID=UPI00117D07A1|nr:M15 family metallopeptidase [Paracoccus sp. M683]TRW99413.1 hypothetical protein FNJ84_01690 [Paracoccus sp. M683]